MKKLLILGAAIMLIAAGCNKAQKNNSNNFDRSTNTSRAENISGENLEPGNTGSVPIQSHRTYSLNMLSNLDDIKPGQAVDIKFNIKDEQGNVLKSFQTEYEKVLHFVVIRKDLQQFQHIHPDFNQQNGEFSITIIFPTDGPYRMFADFAPQNAQMGPDGMPLMVTLNQDVTVGDIAKYKAVPAVVDKDAQKITDNYFINYDFSGELKAQSAITYSLQIEKDAEEVKLEPYLGALGHSVILKEGTLDYIHTHAEEMDMGGMEETGGMQMSHAGVEFTASFPEAGVYKIFTQFQAKGKIITSDYTVKVN